MSSENPTVDVRKGEELDAGAVDAALKSVLPDLKGVWYYVDRHLVPSRNRAMICTANIGL